MGKLEDYIDGLENKPEIEIKNVVSEMLAIHNSEMEIANAKIQNVETKVTEINSTVAERDAEIQRVKAMNWDLANRIPGETAEKLPGNDGDDKPDAAHITIDDLFEG